MSSLVEPRRVVDCVDALRSVNRERTGSVTCRSALRIGESQRWTDRAAYWGVRARDILASDCTLDFHPRIFRHGDCRQSLLAGAPVLIRRVDELDDVAFDLVVRRSFSRHLFDWLTDAAHETGYILRIPHCA
ncbi:MAG TPA: hypothetical protein EYQ32_03370 [Gammaproteobacteria bacterium]|nr:hypothetical protein [Gammaproteobacteria bacterium]